MNPQFRELLKKIGSGPHTSKNLSREESAMATSMILKGEATPAQIGAFMIAHRIKRPTSNELAGMLDTYDLLGSKLSQVEGLVTVFGNPYDGRSRTVPVTPITALILASLGVSVILHGGDSMPTKYGLSLVEIWQGLGVDFTHLTQEQVQKVLEKAQLTLVYLKQFFPLAQRIVPYREEIGKRPPFATIELVWSPYLGDAHLISGFVHPPTEELFQDLLPLRNVKHFTTCKGLEGSMDLPLSRTAITGLGDAQKTSLSLKRCMISAGDYGFKEKDVLLESLAQSIEQIQLVINGKNSLLWESAIFNGGFYLWRLGLCEDIETGLKKAETLLLDLTVKEKLKQLQDLCSNPFRNNN
jgi:anthranilate phosphoribosyltransferase